MAGGFIGIADVGDLTYIADYWCGLLAGPHASNRVARASPHKSSKRENQLQWASVFQASACFMFSKVPVAKRNHVVSVGEKAQKQGHRELAHWGPFLPPPIAGDLRWYTDVWFFVQYWVVSSEDTVLAKRWEQEHYPQIPRERHEVCERGTI